LATRSAHVCANYESPGHAPTAPGVAKARRAFIDSQLMLIIVIA